eukprot:GHVS01091248.1.p1 GENE.GHVS01091248.1~~GHVS01091248.1.p1  ORF type:complete len:247 (+),score=45.63 GHVS01091248.1:147-887(+)
MSVAYRSSPLSSSPDSSPPPLPEQPSPEVLPPPQIEGSYFPPFPAPSSSDAISKLQHLLNNSLAVIAEAMYQVGDSTPAVSHAVASRITNIAYVMAPDVTDASDTVRNTTDQEGPTSGADEEQNQGNLRDCFKEDLVDDVAERAHRLALILGCIKAQISRLPSTTVPLDSAVSSIDLPPISSSDSVSELTGSEALDEYYRRRIRELIRRNQEEEERLVNVSKQLSEAYTEVTDRLRAIAQEGVRLV